MSQFRITAIKFYSEPLVIEIGHSFNISTTGRVHPSEGVFYWSSGTNQTLLTLGTVLE